MGKKVYITERQFNNLVESSKKNKKRNKSKKDINMDCVKANRKARREEARELYGDGFKQNTRIAKSEKTYSRKGKNKFKQNFLDYDED